ncbi:CPCC family cysteine-rich protein [Actinacidiphila glaucinigra]|uniref:CPCC family cysteine-rich protein n=1 Tax=Actinacidiphila glaucinigra TaxID=235986 RepID=UPI0033B15400
MWTRSEASRAPRSCRRRPRAETRSLRAGSLNHTAAVDTRRPCPCCGRLVFDVEDGWPGSYAICPVCFWEDDHVQLRWPFMPVGSNRVPLVQAQQNYQAYGACDQYGRLFVRPPADDEPLDRDWRPIDPVADEFEGRTGETLRPWPDDRSVLCWWLQSFWGCPEEPDPGAPRRVVIDVSSVRSEYDLHVILKRELGFPPIYGMNWSAFWDAITGLVPMPAELCFTGWADLEREVAQAADMLRHQLMRYEATSPDFSVSYDQ